MKTVAEKARVKPGTTIAVLNAVPEVVAALGLKEPAITADPREAKLVFLFVRSRAELDSLMPKAAGAMAAASHLWVFFKKGSGAAGRDMNRDDVWAVAERARLRPVGLLSVDDTWSAFRFKRA